MKWIVCILMVLSLPGFAGLPGWAEKALIESTKTTAPADADVWVLHDETRIFIQRDGKHRVKRYLVKKVLTNQAAQDVGFYRILGDEKATKIKRLNGWHVSKGKTHKINKKNALTLGVYNDQISSMTATGAGFKNVQAGDLLAFESDEVNDTYFSQFLSFVISSEPTLKRIIELEDKGRAEVILRPIGLKAWGINDQVEDGKLVMYNLPVLPKQPYQPESWENYPRVLVGFISADDPLASWDTMAQWYWNLFSKHAFDGKQPEMATAVTREMVQQVAASVRKDITYRMVYLTQSRGWEPNKASEVARLAYGDCKDMTALTSDRLRSQGVQAFPAMVSVADGPKLTKDDFVQPSFNHVICAILLQESLGFDAEVEANGERYLLFDPTTAVVPVGKLPRIYQGRHLLIAHPEGARWVSVPDTCLEVEQIAIKLEGELDVNLSLTGIIEVREQGNAWGLRQLAELGNQRDLAWTLDAQLALPANVNLQYQTHQVTESGEFLFQFLVSWPNFSRRDLGGYRLPQGLIGFAEPKLTAKKETRVHPIELPGFHRSLTLNLSFPMALKTPLPSFEKETDHRKLSWSASTEGKQLKASLVLTGDKVTFDRNHLKDGIAYWDSWRTVFNSFLLKGPVFYQN